MKRRACGWIIYICIPLLLASCLIKNETINRLIIENNIEKLKRWDKTWLNLDKFDISFPILVHQIEKGEMECTNYIILETDYLKYYPTLLEKLVEYAVKSNNSQLLENLFTGNAEPGKRFISGKSFLDYILIYNRYPLLDISDSEIFIDTPSTLEYIYTTGDLADLQFLLEREIINSKEAAAPRWLEYNARKNHWVTFKYLLSLTHPEDVIFEDFQGSSLLPPPFSLGWLVAMYNPQLIKELDLEEQLEKDLSHLPQNRILLELTSMDSVFSGLDQFLQNKWIYAEKSGKQWMFFLGDLNENIFTPIYSHMGDMSLRMPVSAEEDLFGTMELDFSLFRSRIEWEWSLPAQGRINGVLFIPSPAGNGYSQGRTRGLMHGIPEGFTLGQLREPEPGMVPLTGVRSREGYPLYLKTMMDTGFDNLLNLSLWERKPQGMVLCSDFQNNSVINFRKLQTKSFVWTFLTSQDEELILSLCINGALIEGVISGNYSDEMPRVLKGKLIPVENGEAP